MLTPWRLSPLLLLTLCLQAAPVMLEVGPQRALKTPLAARDALRELRASQPLTEGAIIRLDPGIYPSSSTLELGAADSGKPGAPVIWQAAPGGPVILNGGHLVRRFDPVTDPVVAARLPASIRDRVVVLDLASEGVTDFGRIAQRGNPGLELFHRGPACRSPATPTRAGCSSPMSANGGQAPSRGPRPRKTL